YAITRSILSAPYLRKPLVYSRQPTISTSSRNHLSTSLLVFQGGFNKVFLLRVKNSRKVIARIPTPITRPPYYITARILPKDYITSAARREIAVI
ncbi:hypothetical protein N7449_007683, partial [Penicillium cf. viridicatum]